MVPGGEPLAQRRNSKDSLSFGLTEQTSGAGVWPTIPQAISGLVRSVMGDVILSTLKEVRRHFASPWLAPLMKMVEKTPCAFAAGRSEAESEKRKERN